ncbi:MAG TPA: hypothetical protein VIA18_11020, partial [Polyangia bacterium]|nr:hypothetical protein [Polyangia bacterium]
RRAQIEAAAKLEQARIEAEARARIEGKKFPTMQVVGGVVALVLVAAGIMGYLVISHNEELARQQATMQQQADEQRKKLLADEQARQAVLQKQLDDMQAQLAKANTDTEKAQIRAKIAATVAEKSTRAPAASHASAARPAKEKPAAKASIKTTDDPLGGLGL